MPFGINLLRVSTKQSESRYRTVAGRKTSHEKRLAPPVAMGLFVQNRFTRGFSIVKDRLDRATCVGVLPSVELLRNAANPSLGNIPRGGVSRLPFAMGLFVQNRFTQGCLIVKDRLDRATCVDVPPSVELLRNAANPSLGNIPRGGISRLPSRWFDRAKSLYAGIFDCQRSFGQSHLRGCPAVCRVGAKRSESQYRTVATSVGAHRIAKCQNTIRGIRVELVIF